VNECKPLPGVPRSQRERGLAELLEAAQVEIETKIDRTSAHFIFKRLVPGGFNVGLIGTTCTAPPDWDTAGGWGA